jgi:hypothetical protein
MKHIIEISRHDTDNIVTADLKNMHFMIDNDEVKSAIEVVLKYYMEPFAYAEWLKTKDD